MTVVTIATAAGSSGKSTTAVALAALLAAEGRRVLLIDADAQSDATLCLGIEPDSTRASIGDVLIGSVDLADAVVDTPSGVRLVPASPAMAEALAKFSTLRGRDMRLKKVLDAYDDAEVVIVDCPGDATSPVTVAGVCAADHVISTTYASGKESKGLGEIEGLVEEFSDLYGLPAQFSAVVPCAVQPPSRNERAQVHVANIREAFGDPVTPSVRWSELVIGAYDARTPVPLHAPASAVARDYRTVAAALTQRGIL